MNTNVNCSFINYTTNLHKSQIDFFTFTEKCGKIYELKGIEKYCKIAFYIKGSSKSEIR